jgi:putative tryptophan/tyrosine transport system substrate-binding protein
LPALYNVRDYAEAGGLMAYTVDLVNLFTRAAGQIAEILKGANVGDMPFYQATSFKLVINLNAANELGLTLPPTLLARADEVIE